MRVTPLVAGLATVLSASIATAQLQQVIPPAYSAADANSSTAYPWGRTTASTRVQYCFDSSYFTTASINFPIMISRMKWRANGNIAASWTGGTWSNTLVDVSSAAFDFSTVTTSFAGNHGPDRTQVYAGPTTLIAGSSTLATPGPFYVDIAFSVPFRYDPAAGADFLVDLQVDGASWTGGTTASLDCEYVTTGTTTLASRMYDLVNWNGATGTVQQFVGPVIELTYVPAQGLFPAFTATPLSGASPLLVQFTDRSATSDPNGVVAWLWDFDNDGLTDSTQRNPAFTYACGLWSVRLTVVDGTHGLRSVLRTNYIETDPMTAAFTRTLVTAPNVWQFTDTTTPLATAWSWDFTGDGVPDSTARNPVWTFPTSCQGHAVTLDATVGCRSERATERFILAPRVLGSAGAGSAGVTASNPVGGFFDVRVLAQDGVSVCGVTVATYTTMAPFTCDVYVTAGSYLGKDGTASEWRLVGSGSGTGNAGTILSPAMVNVALARPFYLPPGDHGVAVYLTGAPGYLAYRGVAPTTVTNADLSLFPSPAGAPGLVRNALFGGTASSPASWIGQLHYGRSTVSGDAGYGFMGAGCAGSAGIPSLVAGPGGPPRVGQTFTAVAANLPLSAALVLFGLSNTASAFGPLPLNMATFGAPGCMGRVSPDATLFIAGSGQAANWNLPIPNNATLLSQRFFNQALVLDPAANAMGAVVSDAAAGIVGN